MSSASSSRGPAFSKAQYFTHGRKASKWSCNICPTQGFRRTDMTAQAAIRHEQSDEHSHNVTDLELWNPPPDLSGWEVDEVPQTYQDLKAKERQVHVDHVKDIIPFWMRGVAAAEKGESLKMEEFLDSIHEEDRWETNGAWGVDRGWDSRNSWCGGGSGWGKDACWAMDESTASSVHARKSDSNTGCHHTKQNREVPGRICQRNHNTERKRSRYSKNTDDHAFVEDIARQQGADSERTRGMHAFFDASVVTSYPHTPRLILGHQLSTQDKVKRIEQVVRYLRGD